MYESNEHKKVGVLYSTYISALNFSKAYTIVMNIINLEGGFSWTPWTPLWLRPWLGGPELPTIMKSQFNYYSKNSTTNYSQSSILMIYHTTSKSINQILKNVQLSLDDDKLHPPHSTFLWISKQSWYTVAIFSRTLYAVIFSTIISSRGWLARIPHVNGGF